MPEVTATVRPAAVRLAASGQVAQVAGNGTPVVGIGRGLFVKPDGRCPASSAPDRCVPRAAEVRSCRSPRVAFHPEGEAYRLLRLPPEVGSPASGGL